MKTAALLALSILILPQGVLQAKKPPHPLPSSCVSHVCISHLRWAEDSANSPQGSRALTVFGTLENHTQFTLDAITITFTMLDFNGSIIRSVTATLNAQIPTDQNWQFKALTGYVGNFQLVADDVFMTQSARVDCLVYMPEGNRRGADTFNFSPVFNPFEGYAKRKWLKSHPLPAQ